MFDRLFCFLTLLLAMTVQVAAKGIQTPEGFQDDLSIQALKDRAFEAEMPYLIYLHDEANRQTRRMLRRSWSDEEVQRLVQRDFLAGSYSALMQEESLALVQRHQVYGFPALLIFSPQGKLMGKAEGYLAPETLAAILEKHLDLLAHQQDMLAFAGPEPETSRSYQPLSRGYQNRYIVPPVLVGNMSMLVPPNRRKVVQTPDIEEVLNAPIAHLSVFQDDRSQPLVQDASYLQTGMTSRSQAQGEILLDVPGLESYSLRMLAGGSASRTDRFGLLVGNYLLYEEVTQAVSRYERVWRDDIFVYCQEVESNLVYRLILGQYETESAAKAYAQAMYKVEKINPTIVNLNGLIP